MITEIIRLERFFERNYPDFIKKFNPGLDNNEISRFCSIHNFNFSNSLMQLYNWRNGIFPSLVDISISSIIPFGIFTSLQESYQHYQTCSSEENIWPPHLFPILTSGIGDYYLINIGENFKSDTFIYFYSPSLLAIPEITVFDSLESFVLSIIEAYKGNFLSRDSQSKLITSDDYLKFIASKNKNSQYWKY